MARMPRGSTHIANPVSCAPGFTIGNVHVMAGVPSVFQAMLDNVLPTLRSGVKVLSDKVSCPYGEGDIGDPLSAIAKAHPDVNIGSYPRFSGQGFSTEIVIRGRNAAAINAAKIEVETMLADLGPDRLTAPA
jgi:molybdopterin-biosynthesis enzyme MoeA-like protein